MTIWLAVRSTGPLVLKSQSSELCTRGPTCSRICPVHESNASGQGFLGDPSSQPRHSATSSGFSWCATNLDRSRSPWIVMWWATPCAIVIQTGPGVSTSGRCSLKAV